ncbi:MAG TPA: hypothetical protein VFN45_11100 [Myxococcaceae bacterium]|jgi:hypothetical protein|nr:hypothetical protein [Myxococcaceae bacterium]
MRHLVLFIAAVGIGCASRPAEQRETARDRVGSSTAPTAVEAAAKFALTTYVDESTRAQGVVCVELDGAEDPAKVLDRLSPLASRLSAGRKECLDRAEPSAILSIGTPQVAGDRARVDVGVVLGSAGMLELERRQGSWVVVRATSPWLSLR